MKTCARRYLLHLTIFLFAVGCLAPRVPAQVTNVSDTEATPIPGAGHDYTGMLVETVNPANGSLSIRINVPMPLGRKLTVPFGFAYDSNGATNSIAINSTGCNTRYLFQCGWSYTAPIISSGPETVLTQTIAGEPEHCAFYSGYVFTDPTGTRHSFPTMIVTTGNSLPCSQYFGITTNQNGSDAWLSHSANGTQDAAGTTYCNPASGGSGSLCSVEDRNGNLVKYNDSGNGVFTVTDTTGRTAIVSNGFGATGNAVTVSGLGNPYSLTWGTTLTLHYSLNEVIAYNPAPAYGCTFGGPYTAVNTPITLLSVLTLPNGQSYKFYYDATYGLLNEIVYPSGGWVKYTWGVNAQSETSVGTYTTQNGSGPCFWRIDNPAIVERQVSYDGSSVAEDQHYTYGTTWEASPGNLYAQSWSSKNTTVVTNDNVRGTSQTLYTYSAVNIQPPAGAQFYLDTQVPVESTIAYNNWGGGLLKTVTKSWYNQYLLQSEETTWPNSQASEVTYTYGSLGVLTGRAEYDYGTNGLGALTRNTITNYQSFAANSLGSVIYDRPCQTIVYDGSNNRYAETDYLYDNGSAVCGAAGAPSVAGVSNLTGHDETNFGPTSSSPRGNATTIIRQCFRNGQICPSGNPTTTATFDETGQQLSMTDPRVNTTQYSYADSYTIGTPPGNTNAYLTQITYPSTNGAHVEHFSYGYPDGQLTQAKDQNGQATTYKYNDPLDRPTETDYPDGGVTTISYNDAPPTPSVTTSKKLNSAQSIVSVALMDGLFHVTQTQLTSDPQGTISTVKTYDGTGQVYTTTNPYRSASDPTYGTTTDNYDALGRTTSVTRPDSSSTTTQYCGAETLVTDEAGHWRRSKTDGLGRLVEVDEPNSTSAGVNVCPGSGEPIWVTSYAYDPLDNLLSAVQGGSRNRSFAYDSLRRLASSTNPEAGTVTYAYDADGNVTGKTDARSITSTYSYDALNRVTGVTYSNGDPAVSYSYDQATCIGQSPCYNVGRRTTMTDAGGTENLSYDKMGREWGEQRTTNNIPKTTTYTYDLAGNLLTLIYPTGRTITYTYDSAGRPSTSKDLANNLNFAFGPCGGGACYAPQGALSEIQNGSWNLTTYLYNNRLQLCWIYASTSGAIAPSTPCNASDPGQANILDLQYSYNLGSSDNGNVVSIANNRDTTRSQSYAYDQVNRIVGAKTNSTSGANCWGETYSYDQWANLQGIGIAPGYSCGSQEGNWNAPPNGNNQLPSIMTYDASGNTLNDNFNIYQWNAEGEMKSGAAVNYTYDGDGNRLMKSSGTIYWYGAGTEILVETDTSGITQNEYVYFGGKRIARIAAH